MSLDVLKQGLDIVSGGKIPGLSESTSGGIFGKIMEAVGIKKNPETEQKALDTRIEAKKDRTSFFKEASRSLLMRQFPRLMVAWDLYKGIEGAKELMASIKDRRFPDQETFMKSIMGLSALLVLVPNDWKHFITDYLADSKIFQTIVNYWPGMDGVIDLPYLQKYLDKDLPLLGKGGSLRDLIINQKDPDAVIMALRILAQDISTGVVSFSSVRDLLGGSALKTAGALALGGGAAALGYKMLTSNSSDSPEGGLLGGIKDALAGKKGKKILELVKAHPENIPTTMQKNLLALLKQLKVEESAQLIKGDWEDNNDYCTVSYTYNNAPYYLEFDNDLSSTDIKVNNSTGQQIADITDLGNLDADDTAEKILEAMKEHPSPAAAPVAAPVVTPAPAPANDNASAAPEVKKAA
jgi:hypothetical protein